MLNDIGPEIGRGGAAFVRSFLVRDPALPSLDACVAFLRETLPPLSLDGEEDWRTMARLTYEPGGDGRWHPIWDRRIARLLDERVPELWTHFGALADIPLMIVHGAESAILLPDTIERMQAGRPDLVLTTLPGVGHAPTLREPAVTASVRAFLQRHG
ncbi:MAG: hypothetical protein M3Y41_21640 [Pseudomonadota bacterium]|nr:hypothetical protein [Pseudomonadota bacterium]